METKPGERQGLSSSIVPIFVPACDRYRKYFQRRATLVVIVPSASFPIRVAPSLFIRVTCNNPRLITCATSFAVAIHSSRYRERLNFSSGRAKPRLADVYEPNRGSSIFLDWSSVELRLFSSRFCF